MTFSILRKPYPFDSSFFLYRCRQYVPTCKLFIRSGCPLADGDRVFYNAWREDCENKFKEAQTKKTESNSLVQTKVLKGRRLWIYDKPDAGHLIIIYVLFLYVQI